MVKGGGGGGGDQIKGAGYQLIPEMWWQMSAGVTGEVETSAALVENAPETFLNLHFNQLL